MIKPLLLVVSQAILLLAVAFPAQGQTLLLQYTFDDATSPAADTGSAPAAPGTLVATGSASGFVAGIRRADSEVFSRRATATTIT